MKSYYTQVQSIHHYTVYYVCMYVCYQIIKINITNYIVGYYMLHTQYSIYTDAK